MAKIVRTQLLILAGVQGALLLLGLAEEKSGDLGRTGFLVGSMVYLAVHIGLLGVVAMVRFAQRTSTEAVAYLAAMGIILIVGGGTCFAFGS